MTFETAMLLILTLAPVGILGGGWLALSEARKAAGAEGGPR